MFSLKFASNDALRIQIQSSDQTTGMGSNNLIPFKNGIKLLEVSESEMIVATGPQGA